MNAMLETLKHRIQQLIAAYEAEKVERERLQNDLELLKSQNDAYAKQIAELEREIDNLKLAEAFKGGATTSPEAKKKINGLLKEIDRCISLMEG